MSTKKDYDETVEKYFTSVQRALEWCDEIFYQKINGEQEISNAELYVAGNLAKSAIQAHTRVLALTAETEMMPPPPVRMVDVIEGLNNHVEQRLEKSKENNAERD